MNYTNQKEDDIYSFLTEIKPIVLSNIGSDFIQATLDEDTIIKCMFPKK